MKLTKGQQKGEKRSKKEKKFERVGQQREGQTSDIQILKRLHKDCRGGVTEVFPPAFLQKAAHKGPAYQTRIFESERVFRENKNSILTR